MTLNLDDLIFEVRDVLADIPDEWLDSSTIYKNIVAAYAFVNSICDVTEVNEELLKSAVVSLAAYYAYISFVSKLERELGSVPVATRERMNMLKNKARMFLTMISVVPITEDLTIDYERLGEYIPEMTLTYSVDEIY